MAGTGDVLLVFAKAPRAGAVKTRLAPPLTHDEAAALYEAFLRDAMDGFDTLGVDVRLYLPPGDEPPAGILDGARRPYRQRGADLGARLLAAFLDAFRDGADRVIAIGTDHPTLPEAFVRLAFDELREPLRIVIGPSDDGGFYLIGMNDLYPALFAGMTYSHDRVLAETLARASGCPAGLSVLPPWYDVDTPDDLARLAEELSENPDPASPRTREVVANLHEKLARMR